MTLFLQNFEANDKLKQMVKDQQEAEKQKQQSQEIRKLVEQQTIEIAAKRTEVKLFEGAPQGTISFVFMTRLRG